MLNSICEQIQKVARTNSERQSDANTRFEDLRQLLISMGFEERIKSSHHSFRKQGVEEKPNLQRDGSKAKGYQIRQVRNLLRKYNF